MKIVGRLSNGYLVDVTSEELTVITGTSKFEVGRTLPVKVLDTKKLPVEEDKKEEDKKEELTKPEPPAPPEPRDIKEGRTPRKPVFKGTTNEEPKV